MLIIALLLLHKEEIRAEDDLRNHTACEEAALQSGVVAADTTASFTMWQQGEHWLGILWAQIPHLTYITYAQ